MYRKPVTDHTDAVEDRFKEITVMSKFQLMA